MHVGPRRRPVPFDGDREVRQAVIRRPHAVVQLRHQIGDRVDARILPDFAVVHLDVVGPAGAQERPVLEVDSGGVADQNFCDLRFVGVHTGRLTIS